MTRAQLRKAVADVVRDSTLDEAQAALVEERVMRVFQEYLRAGLRIIRMAVEDIPSPPPSRTWVA